MPSEIQKQYLKIIQAYVKESGYKAGDYRRLFRPAKLLLQRGDGDADAVIGRIQETRIWCDGRNINWSLWTVLKRWNKSNTDIPTKNIIRNEGLTDLKELLRRKYGGKDNLV